MEYHSNSDLFEAIESLQKELTASDHDEASALISEGVAGLNGLTDGWAYLLDHLDSANHKYGAAFTSEQSVKLSQIQKVVHGVVHRA